MRILIIEDEQNSRRGVRGAIPGGRLNMAFSGAHARFCFFDVEALVHDEPARAKDHLPIDPALHPV